MDSVHKEMEDALRRASSDHDLRIKQVTLTPTPTSLISMPLISIPLTPSSLTSTSLTSTPAPLALNQLQDQVDALEKQTPEVLSFYLYHCDTCPLKPYPFNH
jgi:hypothetical protein